MKVGETANDPLGDELARLADGDSRRAASVVLHSETSPEAHAEALRLAERVKAPPAAVVADPVPFRRDAARQEVDRLATSSPIVAQWLENPDHYAVARDELPHVAGLEHTARAYAEGLSGGGSARPIIGGGVVRDFLGSSVSGIGKLFAGEGRELQKSDYGDEGDEEDVAAQLFGAAVLEPMGQVLEGGGEKLKEWGAWIAPPKERETILTQVQAGLGQVGAQVATGGFGELAMLGQGADIAGERAKAAGATQAQQDAVAVQGGLVTALSEKLGMGLLMRRLPSWARTAMRGRGVDVGLAALGEGTQEVVEGLGHDVIATQYDPSTEIGQSVFNDFTVAGAVGALARMVLHAHPRVQALDSSTAGADFLEGIQQNLSQGNLAKRSPSALRALVEDLRDAGAPAHAYIGADDFVSLFQSPAEAYAAAATYTDLAGADDLTAVLEAGGDLALPIGKAAQLLSSPVGEAAVQKMKVDPEHLTVSETRAVDREAEVQKVLQELNGVFTRPAERDAGEVAAQDDILGEIIATGRYAPGDAAAMAQLLPRFYAGLARAKGTTVEEERKRYPVSVISDTLGDRIRRRNPNAESAAITPILEALRTGKVPSMRDAYGPTLVDELVKAGGVQDFAGELRTLDAARQRPGLVNQGGISLDDAFTLARDRGFFPPAPEGETEQQGVNDLLELIDTDLRGEGVYRNVPVNPELAALRANVEAWSRELPALLGANETMTELLALSNQAILERARQAAADGYVQGLVLIEPGQVEAVERDALFPESKVVGPDGQLLTLYHGGSFPGEGEFGLPAFFTTDRAAAETYRRSAAREYGLGRITPVHLNITNPASEADVLAEVKALRREEGEDIVPYTEEEIDGGMVMAFEWLTPGQQAGAYEIIGRLQAKGFDGAHLPNDFYLDVSKMMESWVVFEPGQIASADFPGTYFQSPAVLSAPFKSALLGLVETAQGAPKKADATAWIGWLDGAQRRGQIRQAERDWIGLDDWLKGQESVTRAELQEFVRANRLEVSEVVVGGDAIALEKLLDNLPFKAVEREDGNGFDARGPTNTTMSTHATLDEAEQAAYHYAMGLVRSQGGRLPWTGEQFFVQRVDQKDIDDFGLDQQDLGEWALFEKDGDTKGEYMGGLGGASRNTYARAVHTATLMMQEMEAGAGFELGQQVPSTSAPYSSMVARGPASGYRVMKITLPELSPIDRQNVAAWQASMQELVAQRQAMLEDPNLDKRIDGPNYVPFDTLNRGIAQLEERIRDATARNKFTGGHWSDTPQTMMHIRFDERVDADGKRVLFLNELQSDWHQRGRRSRSDVLRRLVEAGATQEEAQAGVPMDVGYKGAADYSEAEIARFTVDQAGGSEGLSNLESQLLTANQEVDRLKDLRRQALEQFGLNSDQGAEAARLVNEAVYARSQIRERRDQIASRMSNRMYTVRDHEGRVVATPPSQFNADPAEALRVTQQRARDGQLLKGYSPDTSKWTAQPARQDGYWTVFRSDGGMIWEGAADSAEAAIAEATPVVQPQERVPDAPFKTTWLELGLKRMVRWAAENGFDRVAWPREDQVPVIEQWPMSAQQIRSDTSGSRPAARVYGAILDRYAQDVPRAMKALGKPHGAQVVEVDIGPPPPKPVKVQAPSPAGPVLAAKMAATGTSIVEGDFNGIVNAPNQDIRAGIRWRDGSTGYYPTREDAAAEIDRQWRLDHNADRLPQGIVNFLAFARQHLVEHAGLTPVSASSIISSMAGDAEAFGGTADDPLSAEHLVDFHSDMLQESAEEPEEAQEAQEVGDGLRAALAAYEALPATPAIAVAHAGPGGALQSPPPHLVELTDLEAFGGATPFSNGDPPLTGEFDLPGEDGGSVKVIAAGEGVEILSMSADLGDEIIQQFVPWSDLLRLTDMDPTTLLGATDTMGSSPDAQSVLQLVWNRPGFAELFGPEIAQVLRANNVGVEEAPPIAARPGVTGFLEYLQQHLMDQSGMLEDRARAVVTSMHSAAEAFAGDGPFEQFPVAHLVDFQLERLQEIVDDGGGVDAEQARGTIDAINAAVIDYDNALAANANADIADLDTTIATMPARRGVAPDGALGPMQNLDAYIGDQGFGQDENGLTALFEGDGSRAMAIPATIAFNGAPVEGQFILHPDDSLSFASLSQWPGLGPDSLHLWRNWKSLARMGAQTGVWQSGVPTTVKDAERMVRRLVTVPGFWEHWEGNDSGQPGWSTAQAKAPPRPMNQALEINAPLRAAAMGGMVLFQEGRGDERGSIQFPRSGVGEGAQSLIRLAEGADQSTFLHELGHFYLEVLSTEAAQPDAPTRLREDFDRILSWFGVEDRSSWHMMGTEARRPYHEQFARGFEAYLGEGKAPAPGLRGAFRKFRAWIKSVYLDLTTLNVDITPDIRGVFDRLLASDEEIAAAAAEQGLVPSIDPKAGGELGLPPNVLANYQAAMLAAQESLQAKTLNAKLREQKAWYRAEVRAERERVRQETATMPVYVLQDALKAGPVKLDRAEVAGKYGVAVLPRLRGLYAAEGGSPMEAIADLHSYPGPEAMIDALLNAPPKEQYIRGEASARVRERHGDPLTDGTAPALAMEALHNGRMAKALDAEVAALAHLAGEPRPKPGVLAEVARRLVASMIGRSVQPNQHLVAERKAANEAAKAAAAQDWGAALLAKRQQALNAALYVAAKNARADMDRLERRAKRLQTKAGKERMASAGAESYYDRVQEILGAYEFRRVPARTVARRASLRGWVEGLQAAGEVTALSEELLQRVESERVVNWQDIPVSEIRAVDEALANIEHLAALKNRLLAGARAATKAEAIALMRDRAAAMLALRGPDVVDKGDLSRGERLIEQLRSMTDAITRPEWIIEALDGGEQGPFHDFLWRPQVDAENAKIALMQRIGAGLKAVHDALPGDFQDSLNAAVSFRGVKMRRYALLSAAFNLGNAGNRQRLRDGGITTSGGKALRVDEEGLVELSSLLTAREWKYVQAMWDVVGSLGPDIEALQRELGGIPLTFVQPVPLSVTTADGQTVQLRGGYWPLVYHTDRSAVGERQESDDAMQILMQAGQARAATSKGHTKERVEEFSAPLRLNFGEILSRSFEHVMTDLAYRKAVRDVSLLLKDSEFKAFLIGRIGRSGYDAINGGLAYSVSGGADVAGLVAGGWRAAMDWTMANGVVSALAIRPDIALGNYGSALVQGLARVSRRYLMRGLRKLMLSRDDVTAKITAKSPMMRNRLNEIDHGYQEQLRKTRDFEGRKGGFKVAYFRVMMTLHRFADHEVTRALWWGRYEQALADGALERDAIELADTAVRMTQTSTGKKDASIFERDPAFKQMRMFMGPMYVQFGNLLAASKGQGTTRQVGARYSQLLIAWVFAPALFALLAGRAPDDDDKDGEWSIADWARWAGLNVGLYPVQTIPILRDVEAVGEALLTGKRVSPRQSPTAQALDSLSRSAQSLWKNSTSDDPLDYEDATADLVGMSAPFTGLPGSQYRKSQRGVDYLLDNPDTGVLTTTELLLYGKPVYTTPAEDAQP